MLGKHKSDPDALKNKGKPNQQAQPPVGPAIANSPNNWERMAVNRDFQAGLIDDFQNNLKAKHDAQSYDNRRKLLLDDERAQSWDSAARRDASEAELKAQDIIFRIRESERRDPSLFGNLPSEQIPDSSTRDLGGQFLVNKPRIESSKLFEIAKQMPKGAHQHLHFNCEIQPEHLFPQARLPELEKTMCIRTTIPLCNDQAFDDTEIVFKVLAEHFPKANVFSADYRPDKANLDSTAYMLWSDFRQRFPNHIKTEAELDGIQDEALLALDKAELWAREKMIVTKEDVYTSTQTHNGSWACFNQGTRAFKGLVGYEGVYRWYIGELIDSMIRDRVMYAELRPMLMDKTMPSNDGLRMLDHKDQMNIIVEEVNKKKEELRSAGELEKFQLGLKIIYCTPRSIPRTRQDKGRFPSCMEMELEDCLKLKTHFPDLICGFDLVGAEDRHNSIGFYADMLEAFQKTCAQHGVKIPFLFHAGESLLDTGGSFSPDNGNLYDALLLSSKRIGHGYAILKHPGLVEQYKRHNICLELCPISNELLHLCGNIRQHPYPQLLAAGLHCTLNADNPSMYSSSLSHEFYQVMVGDTRMTIHGWKQLAQWSLEHSCLSQEEIKMAKLIHERDFEDFCQEIVKRYSKYADELESLWLRNPEG